MPPGSKWALDEAALVASTFPGAGAMAPRLTLSVSPAEATHGSAAISSRMRTRSFPSIAVEKIGIPDFAAKTSASGRRTS
jgi:hypothetical protein